MEDNTRISSLLKMVDIRIRQDLDARNQDLHISSSQMRALSYLIANTDHEINPRDLEQYSASANQRLPAFSNVWRRRASCIMRKAAKTFATNRSFWMSRHIDASRSCGITSARWNPSCMPGFPRMSRIS